MQIIFGAVIHHLADERSQVCISAFNIAVHFISIR